MTKLLSKHVEIDLDEDAAEDRTVNDTDGLIDVDALSSGSKPDADVIDEDINPDDKLPTHAIQNSDGSVTIPLVFPVTLRTRKGGKISEKTYADLTFHRLNGADQRAIAAASAEASVAVALARSTRLNQAIMNALFDRMDMADITDCGRVLNHFLTSGRKTGR